MTDTSNMLGKFKSLRDFMLKDILPNVLGKETIEVVLSQTQVILLISAVDEIIGMGER